MSSDETKKDWSALVVIALYVGGILILTFDVIRSVYFIDGLLTGFLDIFPRSFIALEISFIILQIFVLLTLLFKKKWFHKHVSFKFISFFLLIPSVILAWLQIRLL